MTGNRQEPELILVPSLFTAQQSPPPPPPPPPCQNGLGHDSRPLFLPSFLVYFSSSFFLFFVVVVVVCCFSSFFLGCCLLASEAFLFLFCLFASLYLVLCELASMERMHYTYAPVMHVKGTSYLLLLTRPGDAW